MFGFGCDQVSLCNARCGPRAYVVGRAKSCGDWSKGCVDVRAPMGVAGRDGRASAKAADAPVEIIGEWEWNMQPDVIHRLHGGASLVFLNQRPVSSAFFAPSVPPLTFPFKLIQEFRKER